MTDATPRLVEIERRIAAPPETVFSFFTDPELYRLWRGAEAEVDARPGGRFRVRIVGQTDVTAVGEYLEVDPPKRLVYTWRIENWAAPGGGHHDLPSGTSRVEVSLTPDGDDTILRLRHHALLGARPDGGALPDPCSRPRSVRAVPARGRRQDRSSTGRAR